MAASKALALLAAAATVAAADNCPNLWTLANVAQQKTIQDIGANRCVSRFAKPRARRTLNWRSAREQARACPNRRSAREQARAFHAHYHTTMFICLLSGI